MIKLDDGTIVDVRADALVVNSQSIPWGRIEGKRGKIAEREIKLNKNLVECKVCKEPIVRSDYQRHLVAHGQKEGRR